MYVRWRRELRMRCKLCEQEKPLVRAHIVARCLLERLKEGGHVSRYAGERGVLPARTPTGEYDTEILCRSCDSYFSPWEEYAADLLHKSAPAINPSSSQQHYFVKQYDYTALKLCFLSILWRMSVSRRDIFDEIGLGPYEQTIKKMLLNKDPGTQSDFPIMLMRYKDKVGSLTMWGADRTKADGINMFRFGIPGYRVFIKVD